MLFCCPDCVMIVWTCNLPCSPGHWITDWNYFKFCKSLTSLCSFIDQFNVRSLTNSISLMWLLTMLIYCWLLAVFVLIVWPLLIAVHALVWWHGIRHFTYLLSGTTVARSNYYSAGRLQCHYYHPESKCFIFCKQQSTNRNSDELKGWFTTK